MDQFERIIQKLVELMENTEKHCRKFNAGRVEFSSTIQAARNTVGFWHMKVKEAKEIGINRQVLRRKLLLMDKEFYIKRRVALDKAFRIQRAAKRHLQELSNKAEELRRDWQQELCVAKALEENTSAAAQIKR